MFSKSKGGRLPATASRLWRTHNPLMTCTVCGKPYPCAHCRRNASALLQPRIPNSADAAAPCSGASSAPSAIEVLDRVERERWRREVISRVQQHRARRRRFDPSASLDLAFPADDVTTLDAAAAAEQEPVLPPWDDAGADDAALGASLVRSSARSRSPKIIRFPQPSSTDNELADPVLDTPRILDEPETAPVAEQMDLLESFADLHLEPTQPSEADLPLPPQPAPLWQRSASGLMDAVIVMAAAAMFAATFVKLAAAAVPTSRLAGLCAVGVAVTIWSVFQYLFLVYGRGTPGMRAARLELRNLAGRSASRFARRCRALATVLSGLSLGLGFAWTLVDEDTLGWHDRISGTYLRTSDHPISFFLKSRTLSLPKGRDPYHRPES